MNSITVMDRSLALCFFLFSGLIIHESNANIGHFDEYWQEKAKNAENEANETYNPDPHNVTNHLNREVRELFEGKNGTRRNLRKYTGPCRATNPIDRCWRCKSDWDKNRKKLADCVLGFGHKTRGGQAGKIYVVTDSSDNDMANPKPGTLRHAVIQAEPLWITFAMPMVIKLNQELIMTSHKTIDARGANVHISAGAGITIQFVKNIIIHGLHIHDIVPGSGGMIRDSVSHLGLRSKSDGDGISIYGSVNVWIDHVSMRNCADGLIDAIQGSTGITISNCHFTHHNDVMLFGASDKYNGDKKMQITVAFNHFGKGLIQRMPRCRHGYFHVVNNDYTHWIMYAIGGSSHPTIISQGNRFIAPPHLPFSHDVTKRDYAPQSEWKKWQWRSENDLMMNGAFFVQSGQPRKKSPFPADMIKAEPGTSVTTITRVAGPLSCAHNKPC